MRYGSVCSGIEAATVAWHPLGWTPAWFSEIEPFPSAVLAHHYPKVKNLGDMTTLPNLILNGEVEAPDVLVGGTPCQAFSVAGLRNSLEDNRGQLSLTYINILDTIDFVRRERGAHPAIAVWENVPGVLNTKDNAFGCFLAGLAGEDVPLEPTGEKWTNAGCVYGPKRAVAWRVLDAQYFGVAQRRRRVFVIASSRAGFTPAEVLFEFTGVRRDSPPSRETKKESAYDVAACLRSGGRGGVPSSRGEHLVYESHPQDSRVTGPLDVAPTVSVKFAKGSADTPLVTTHRMVAFGEYIDDDTASAMKARDYKDATDLVAYSMITANTNANGLGVSVEIAPTMDRAQPCAIAYGIQGNMIGRSDTAGPQGSGVSEDVMFTQTKADIHAVCYENHAQDSRVKEISVASLHAKAGTGGGNLPLVQQAPTYSVRRLTPIECERLQAFPDGYTNIQWRKKPDAPDGARYKALGNSMCCNVMHWIGKRIHKYVK